MTSTSIQRLMTPEERAAWAGERWSRAARAEWDGDTPLFSDSRNRYFADLDQLEDYIKYNDVADPDELLLYICEPQTGRILDSTFFDAQKPEDGELPDAIYDAIDAFNKAVAAVGTLCYMPGKTVPIINYEKGTENAEA